MPDLGADFPVRLASASVLAAVALAGAWLGGWPAALIVAATVVVVHLEWIGLTESSAWPAAIFTVILAAAVVVAAAGFLSAGPGLVGLGISLVGLGIIGAAVTAGGLWRPLGVGYAALLGLGLLILRLAPEFGFEAIVVLFAVVWATDTGAFFAGRLIRGPKMWPRISPKKTWAGAVGGLALGIAAGGLAAAAFGLGVGGPLLLVIAALSAVSQAGDLFESWVKRRFGAKNSSRLIPGHGGLMDRVDGLTFAAGLAVVIGWCSGGPTHVSAGLLQW